MCRRIALRDARSRWRNPGLYGLHDVMGREVLGAVVMLRPAAHPTAKVVPAFHYVDGHAAAYVCEGFVCRAPVTDPVALSAALD